MTDFSDLLKADNHQPARSIRIVDAQGLDAWLAGQPERVRTLVAAQKFKGKAHDHAILPGDDPADWSVIAGSRRARSWGRGALPSWPKHCPMAPIG